MMTRGRLLRIMVTESLKGLVYSMVSYVLRVAYAIMLIIPFFGSKVYDPYLKMWAIFKAMTPTERDRVQRRIWKKKGITAIKI